MYFGFFKLTAEAKDPPAATAEPICGYERGTGSLLASAVQRGLIIDMLFAIIGKIFLDGR